MELVLQTLDRRHDRANFLCGADSVDRFLKEFARKRADIKAATTIVATQPENHTRIVGYYTLVPHEFRGEELPDFFRKQTGAGKLSRVPGVLLAQLGVDMAFQGQGVGPALIRDAWRRCARLATEFGAVALVTDPIDERATKLYASFDFEPIALGERRMIVAMKKILATLEKEQP